MTTGEVLRVLERKPRKAKKPGEPGTPNYRRVEDKWERAPGWFSASRAGRQ